MTALEEGGWEAGDSWKLWLAWAYPNEDVPLWKTKWLSPEVIRKLMEPENVVVRSLQTSARRSTPLRLTTNDRSPTPMRLSRLHHRHPGRSFLRQPTEPPVERDQTLSTSLERTREM